jgi:hypothetical protein
LKGGIEMMVIKKNRVYVDLSSISYSIHSQEKGREKRMSYVGDIASMHVLKSFSVDRGHFDGPEIHLITTDGYIIIVNAWTFKLCTVLIARPGQIDRYYKAINQKAPVWLLDKAFYNQKRKLNKL